MLLIVAFIILKSVKIVKCVETLQSQINYTSTTSRPSTPTWPKLSTMAVTAKKKPLIFVGLSRPSNRLYLGPVVSKSSKKYVVLIILILHQ